MRRLSIGSGVAVLLLGSFFPLLAQAAQPTFSILTERQNKSLQVMTVRAGNAQAALVAARALPGVVHAELEQTYQIAAVPDDPGYRQQWALPAIGAPAAWDSRTDARSVTVAVIDSGVDTTNPDLSAAMWTNTGEVAGNGVDDDANGYVDDVHGWNFVEGTNDPRPQVTPDATPRGIHHGTAIAGIIGASGNNNLAVTGMAWQASIMAIRALDSTGSGTTGEVALAIRYAVAEGADVINLSFVGSGTSTVLRQAIVDARAAGVIVVAAAGNDNLNLDVTPQYPACYDGVVGVASVGATDVKSSFSNYGSCVDITAPGENIISTLYVNAGAGYTDVYGTLWSGTSVASPFVVGALALLKASQPTLTASQAVAALQGQTVSISALNSQFSTSLGAGRLAIGSLLSVAQTYVRTTENIFVVPRRGDTPRVREVDAQGKVQAQFLVAAAQQQAGSYVTSGDLDGDGMAEIISTNQAGTQPLVRIANRQGKQLRSFLAYAANFRGGVSVAVGDVTGDGVLDIITGTDSGRPHIRIFSSTGEVLGQFFAFDAKYKGGVSVATADVNGDGVAEIVVSKLQGEARVTIYRANGSVVRSFLTFPVRERIGVYLSIGDVDADGAEELVVGAATGSPRVRILNLLGTLEREFYAYDRKQTGGVHVAVGDTNGDGTDDIVTGTGRGAKPEVRIYRNAGKVRSAIFTVFSASSRTGVHVGVVPAV